MRITSVAEVPGSPQITPATAKVRQFAYLALSLVWGVAIGVCLLDALNHPETELRHRDTLATARLAVGLMALAWCLMILKRTSSSSARFVWTLGAVTLAIHIVVAIWLSHGWSHSAAIERVREVGGFGGGILISYLFVLVWLIDTAWWWIDPSGHAQRPVWLRVLVHGFLIFVMFNATEIYVTTEMRIVYASTIWLPIVACLLWRLVRN